MLDVGRPHGVARAGARSPAAALSVAGRTLSAIVRTLGIDRRPQAADAVGVVGHHPVAHELRRHRNDHPVAVDMGQIERLQPGGIGGVADLGPQQAAHLGPLMLDIGCLRKDHSHLRPRLPAVSGVSWGASSREAPRLRWMPRGALPSCLPPPLFRRLLALVCAPFSTQRRPDFVLAKLKHSRRSTRDRLAHFNH